MNKIVVYLSTLFPARPKQANVTCRPAVIPTLGTQIGSTPTEAPNYRQAFRDWGWIR